MMPRENITEKENRMLKDCIRAVDAFHASLDHLEVATCKSEALKEVERAREEWKRQRQEVDSILTWRK